MRSDQVLNLIGTVLAELDGESSLGVTGTGPQRRLRRQRQAMILESGVTHLAASMPLPGFRGRLAWQLPSARTSVPNGNSEDDLARRACRIARQRFLSQGSSAPGWRHRDSQLARLVPGADAEEIRLAAFGGRRRPGRAINAQAEPERPASTRLLAALAVIAVGLRQAPDAG